MNQFYLKSPTMSYTPEYMSGFGGFGMVSPANIATFGAMELGRSQYSYARAIARTKAKIKLLRRKRRAVRSKFRKQLLSNRINKLIAKRDKLIAYKKIREQRKLDKAGDVPIAEDETFLLEDAFTVEPEIPEVDLQQQEQMEIESGLGIDTQQLLLYGGLGLVALLGVRFLTKKKAPRKNRMKMGKKRSNPKRRRKGRIKRRR